MFGSEDVLVPAKMLLDGDRVISDVRSQGTTYINLLLDRHEVIFAEGQPTESFHPGEASARAFDTATRDELLALFPQLIATAVESPGMVAARQTLKSDEAQLLRSLHGI